MHTLGKPTGLPGVNSPHPFLRASTSVLLDLFCCRSRRQPPLDRSPPKFDCSPRNRCPLPPILSPSASLGVNSVEGPVGIGTRFYVEKEIRGQVRRYDCVIERWEENRCFDFTAEAPGFSRLQAEWTLVPEGEGCRFTMREQINVQNVNWLVDRLFVQRRASRAVRGFQAQCTWWRW